MFTDCDEVLELMNQCMRSTKESKGPGLNSRLAKVHLLTADVHYLGEDYCQELEHLQSAFQLFKAQRFHCLFQLFLINSASFAVH